MKLLILSDKFPNINQPWLLRSIISLSKKGVEVEVLSLQKGDALSGAKSFAFDGKVTTIRLLDFGVAIEIFKNFLMPWRLPWSIQGLMKLQTKCRDGVYRLNNLVEYLALSYYISTIKADVVHSHFEMSGYKFLPLVESIGLPMIATYHGLPPDGVPSLSEEKRKKYVEYVDEVILNTAFAKKQFESIYGGGVRVNIIPQGVDLSKFKLPDCNVAGHDKIRIISIGRLTQEKGHIYALQAIKKLIQSGVLIEFCIIGQGSGKKNLIDYINIHGLGEHVTIIDSVTEDELIPYYQRSDILVFPSIKSESSLLEETQGVVIQEAQACGCIVVASMVGGIPECVIDGENAFLVKERDAEAIAKTIYELYVNKDKWDEYINSSRKYVEENFDIDAITDEWMRVYYRVLARKYCKPGENNV